MGQKQRQQGRSQFNNSSGNCGRSMMMVPVENCWGINFVPRGNHILYTRSATYSNMYPYAMHITTTEFKRYYYVRLYSIYSIQSWIVYPREPSIMQINNYIYYSIPSYTVV